MGGLAPLAGTFVPPVGVSREMSRISTPSFRWESSDSPESPPGSFLQDSPRWPWPVRARRHLPSGEGPSRRWPGRAIGPPFAFRRTLILPEYYFLRAWPSVYPTAP